MKRPSLFIYGFAIAAVALCIWLIGAAPKAATNTADVYNVIRPGRTHAQTLKKLRAHGRSDDLSVRLASAKLLLALGDKKSGSEICQAILHNPALDAHHRIKSAGLLEQYGVLIPFEILDTLYNETKDPFILWLMAMQGQSPATKLILEGHTAGYASETYFLLAHADTNGVAARRAADEIIRAEGADFTSLAIYHARVMNDDRPLREVVTMLESEAPKDNEPIRDRRYDGEAFWLVINVKSEVIRDYLRRRITHMHPQSATYALASLYAVQKDYAFIDSLLSTELAKGKVNAFEHAVFWRIVARRSPHSEALANLVERHASREIQRAYFGYDSWLVDDYWIGSRISHRPLSDR